MTRRARAGFTLVEIIVVVVIIGLLATIVIPKFSSSRERALVTAMKSDLRNLLTVQEGWMADSGSYATSFPTTIWRTSTGVTGPTITLTANGWTASVGHMSTAKTCAIFVGTTPLAPATKEGVPTCI
ncbi:MAG TPA: prepilin-type N-terminal cleavage/methylation domain-containing protein [Gemmatimonadales bacterium]